MSGSQFLRIYGYPRGQRSAAGTLESVIAEGLRDETHIGHLRQQPDIRVFTNPDSPVVHPSQLGSWIHKMMNGCRYGQSDRHVNEVLSDF